MSKCKRCHREIINPKSVQHGYGPVCWIKMQKSNDTGEPDKVPGDRNEDFIKAMPEFCREMKFGN
ncbi:MAG: DUF6011 domain-containing protein [Candidatus Desantisbacteria bacterium]